MRVDVVALGGFRRAVAREEVAQALDARRRSDHWIVRLAGVTYR
ncbi:hypothetical protein AB0M20_41135 [Actinoplanes sp. NPDC051633]